MRLLNENEQGDIRTRLLVDFLGMGVFLLGYLSILFRNQVEIGLLFEACGAFILGGSALYRGVIGLIRGSNQQLVDQIIAVAVLSSASVGDFLTAALIPFVFNVGRLFEERTVLGRQAAIDQLQQLIDKGARHRWISNAQVNWTWRNNSELKPKDRFVVLAGDRVPIDSQVVEGESLLEVSAITGESLPQPCTAGDCILAGSLNLKGRLTLEVRSSRQESSLERMIALLKNVEQEQPQLVEQIFALYLPLVLIGAGCVLWTTQDSQRAIGLVVALVPSALIVSHPAVMVAALSMAAKHGLLIKRSVFFEKILEIDCFAFDKTGTLTVGRPVVEELHPISVTENELLFVASTVAYNSSHPLSVALVEEAEKRDVQVAETQRAQEDIGQGVCVVKDAEEWRIGRLSWLKAQGIDVNELASKHTEQGVWVSRSNKLIGFIALNDPVHPQALDLCQDFKAQEMHLVLLSGDKKEIAERLQLPLNEVHAELLPEEKAAWIEASKKRVCMVGDGVNDALALNRADVGIAIGADLSAAALGGASAALMSSNLSILSRIRPFCLQIRAVFYQNLAMSLTVGICVAFLAGLGFLTPLESAILPNIALLLIVLNSARIFEDCELLTEEEHEENEVRDTQLK